MSKDHNEQAFPNMSHEYGPVLGLSIRDYFAASVAQGLASNQKWLENAAECGIPPLESISMASYEVADAMLEARSK